MNPKPGKLKENVTLSFRHLKVNTTIKTLLWFCTHLVENVFFKLNLF